MVRDLRAKIAAAIRANVPLRRFLHALAQAVSGAGGSTFLAGGYLRGIADGRPGADVDAMVAGLSHRALGEALDALPRARLGIRKVVAAGKHFPVFRVATRWGGRYVDVSSARGGNEASSPDPFAQALSDAARRDFTINSLLYELLPRGSRLLGELVDAFGGLADLAGRTIRCVGSPDDRLREDPVRALRAIRMKSERKGYRIDPATWRSLSHLGPALLPTIPADRLAGELLRSLEGNPPLAFDDLRRSGILRALLPELARKKRGAERARRRYAFLVRSYRGPLPAEILLANLLLDLPPGEAEGAARRLRFPNVRRVVGAVSDLHALRHPDETRFPLARAEAILARQESQGPFIAFFRAAAACDGARAKDLKHFIAHCGKVPCIIDGHDLKRIGLPEGPEREEALLAVREATLQGKIRGRAAALEMAKTVAIRKRANTIRKCH